MPALPLLFPVEAAVPREAHVALRERLGPLVHLGTSSWHFPGWQGLVWAHREATTTLSVHGLAAYGQHPLLRCVSVDRSFYRPVDTATFAAMADQVPDDFRFVVKAPALVTDASQRAAADGRVIGENPAFLDPELAASLAARPAAQGLGPKLGALVFQLSPLPARWLRARPDLQSQLAAMFEAVRAVMPAGAAVGLEVRDPELLEPELARLLKAQGVRYVAGLHDRMPPLEKQLPMLRAVWPGPLICRWNLHRGYAYADARRRFEPFDRLVLPDVSTRTTLARVVAGTVGAGHAALVTINNKAEGSAPCSVEALAEALAKQFGG